MGEGEKERGSWTLEFNLVSECTRPRYKYFYLSEWCRAAEISR